MRDFSPLPEFFSGRSFNPQRLCTPTDSYHCSILLQPGPVIKQPHQAERSPTSPHWWLSVRLPLLWYPKERNGHIKKIKPTHLRLAVLNLQCCKNTLFRGNSGMWLMVKQENTIVVVKQRTVWVALWRSSKCFLHKLNFIPGKVVVNNDVEKV